MRITRATSRPHDQSNRVSDDAGDGERGCQTADDPGEPPAMVGSEHEPRVRPEQQADEDQRANEGLRIEHGYGLNRDSAGILKYTASAAAIANDGEPLRYSMRRRVLVLMPTASAASCCDRPAAIRALRTASLNVITLVDAPDAVQVRVLVYPHSGICGVTIGEEVVECMVACL